MFSPGGDLSEELRRGIQQPGGRLESVLTKIIGRMATGVDMAYVFPEMVMAAATTDIVQKKLVYLYMCTYAARRPDLALLAVNTLCKDCQDPNPLLRGLALRSLCSLRQPELVEYVQEPMRAGLRDSAAYVRRIAVLGCAKMHNLHPEAPTDAAVVNELYAMLRDKDPVVMVNCLRSLDEVLLKEGGVVINRPIAHYLITRLQELDDWGQTEVLNFLLRYHPRSEDETFDLLTTMDFLFRPGAPLSVAIAAACLFLHFLRQYPTAQGDVLERLRVPLLNALTSDSSELCLTVLYHIKEILRCCPGFFLADYKRFFCRHGDPSYVKLVKVEVLGRLVAPDNARDVLTELRAYCTDICPQVARAAILAIGQMASSHRSHCLTMLKALLGLKQVHISSAVLQACREMVSKHPEYASDVCTLLPGCNAVILDTEGRRAILWLLGHCGTLIPSAPYMLESLLESIAQERDTLCKMDFLNAGVRLFLSRPPESQELLGHLLQHSIEEEEDMLVRDRALLYLRLLQAGPECTRHVVCGSDSESRPVDHSKSDVLSRGTLAECLLPAFGSFCLLSEKDAWLCSFAAEGAASDSIKCDEIGDADPERSTIERDVSGMVPSTQSAVPLLKSLAPPSQSATPPPESLAPPSQSATPPSQSPAPPSQSATPPPESPAPPSQSATPPSQSPAPPSQSPAPPSQSPAPPSQSPAPPSPSSAPPSPSSAPPSQSQVPPRESLIPPSQSEAPLSESLAPPSFSPATTTLQLCHMALAPAQFEALWKAWSPTVTVFLHWNDYQAIDSTESSVLMFSDEANDQTGWIAVGAQLLQPALHAVGVTVIAVSRQEVHPWKAYVCAHEQKGTLMLANLQLDQEPPVLAVTVKEASNDKALCEAFAQLLGSVLHSLCTVSSSTLTFRPVVPVSGSKWMENGTTDVFSVPITCSDAVQDTTGPGV